jgi:hypothetical protein
LRRDKKHLSINGWGTSAVKDLWIFHNKVKKVVIKLRIATAQKRVFENERGFLIYQLEALSCEDVLQGAAFTRGCCM